MKTIRIALLPLLVVLATPALAGKDDWLHYPWFMGRMDFAVDMGALAFRPDGLLAAASRYPHDSGEPWIEEQEQRGTHTYRRRLIDCETGYYVGTDHALLDKQGATIVTIAVEGTGFAEDVVRQLRDKEQLAWPRRDDIFLSCAAASNTIVQDLRKIRARKPKPRFSNAPASIASDPDSELLFSLMKVKFDFPALAKQAPTSAAIFDLLGLQYARWYKSINAGYARPKGRTGPENAAFLARVNGHLNIDELGGGVKAVNGMVVDAEYEVEYSWVQLPGNVHTRIAREVEVARIDCATGISVPLARRYFDQDNAPLASVTESAKDALSASAKIYGNYGGNSMFDWPGIPGPMPIVDNAYPICQALNLVNGVAVREMAGIEPAADALPFGLIEADLLKETKPAALLFKVRAARHAYLNRLPPSADSILDQ